MVLVKERQTTAFQLPWFWDLHLLFKHTLPTLSKGGALEAMMGVSRDRWEYPTRTRYSAQAGLGR